MISIITVECVMFSLIYIFLMSSISTLWIGWVIFGMAIIIALPISYVSFKFIRFSAILISFLAGGSLACVLQNAVIYLIQFEYSFFITIGAICYLNLVLTQMFIDHSLRICLSIIASYLIMRGIGLILSYRFEFTIYYERKVFQTSEMVSFCKNHNIDWSLCLHIYWWIHNRCTSELYH